MEDRQWMYTGWRSKRDFDDEWMVKTNDFFEFASANSRGHLLVWCLLWGWLKLSHTNNERKLKLKNQNQNTEQRTAKSSFLNS
jgi:hypothetical protein